MKFITLLSIAMILFSITFAHRIRKVNIKAAPNCLTPTNKWLAFFKALVVRALAIKDADLQNLCTCLTGLGWDVADNKTEAHDKKADEPKTTLQKVLDGISKVLKFVCNFKSQIAKLLVGRRFRRSVKLFLQNEKGLWDDIKGVAGSIGDKFAKLGDWAKKKWEDCVSFGRDLINSWKGHWSHFVETCKALYAKIMAIYKTIKACYDTLKAAITAVIKFFKAIADRSVEISRIAAGDPLAIATFFINCICQFDLFREGITALMDGIAQADVLQRYTLYGKSVGVLIRILLGLTSF
jgi:hypothetical protein